MSAPDFSDRKMTLEEQREALAKMTFEVVHESEEPAPRSSVQIDTTSKGFAMVRVKVYAGETQEELDRIKNLAVTAYEKTNMLLGPRARLG